MFVCNITFFWTETSVRMPNVSLYLVHHVTDLLSVIISALGFFTQYKQPNLAIAFHYTYIFINAHCIW